MKPQIVTAIVPWLLAIVVWLALSISLGWYYTFTYYGRAGWPMPMMEPCLALVLYYFSVLNVDTEIQAIHWVIVFPLAGAVWTCALWLVARRFHARNYPLGRVALLVALTSVPLVLPLPYMTWVAGKTGAGFDARHMLAVALRHDGIPPWPALSPMYFALGLVSMGLQVAVYRRAFSARGKQAWLHFLAAAIAATLGACMVGALAAVPLRAWLE